MSETLTEAARTRRAVAEMLDDPRCLAFPDHPVLLDGTELLWRVCDVALTYARYAKPGAPMFSRWLAALPDAVDYVRSEQQEFERTGEPCPTPEPTRDAATLNGLRAPLVLTSAKVPADG